MRNKDILMLYAKSDVEQAKAIRDHLELFAKLAKVEHANIEEQKELSHKVLDEAETISFEATRLYAFSERQFANARKVSNNLHISIEDYNKLVDMLRKVKLSANQRLTISDFFVDPLRNKI